MGIQRFTRGNTKPIVSHARGHWFEPSIAHHRGIGHSEMRAGLQAHLSLTYDSYCDPYCDP
jgi:hypothetical protein